MFLTSIVGTGLAVYSATGLATRYDPKGTKIKKVVTSYLKDCRCAVMSEVSILGLYRQDRGRTYRMRVMLPYGMGLFKFESHIEGIELATGSKVKSRHIDGRVCDLYFGFHPFREAMDYDDLVETSPLAVPVYSPFGSVLIDFSSETNCHLLIGGATRMGKTVLLRLIATHLLRKTNGNLKIVFIDNKITDLNMFRNIPQIVIAETIDEAKAQVDDLLALAGDRKERIKAKGDVVDAKEFRKKYPNEPMEPVFCIIDEYGRFAEDNKFQERIIEVAETAGYLDIHLIIATQRPDATSAIKPRIKANIVTRIAFTTADEANSNLILGVPDAARLGRIQGRAIVLDGFPETVQVPYLSSEHAKSLLTPYYRKSEQNDGERQEDHSTPAALPGFVAGSPGADSLPAGIEAPRNRKPRSKKTGEGRLVTARSTDEG